MNGSRIDMRHDGTQWINLTVRPDERPARAVAFEQMPEADALAKHPELQGAVRELAAGRTEAARLYPSDYRQRDSHIASVRKDIQRRLDDGRIPPLPPRSGNIAHDDRER